MYTGNREACPLAAMGDVIFEPEFLPESPGSRSSGRVVTFAFALALSKICHGEEDTEADRSALGERGVE